MKWDMAIGNCMTVAMRLVNYQKALSLDPTDARASFMIGRIFETQGYGQEPIYMRYYQDAIQRRCKFCARLLLAIHLLLQRDVNKAAEYLNKYIAVADNDSKNCYAKASLLYVSKKYTETISQADACMLQQVQKTFPNLYGLKAYAYDKMGDSLKAKESFEKFFSVVNPDKIGPTDYEYLWQGIIKISRKEAEAWLIILKKPLNWIRFLPIKLNT